MLINKLCAAGVVTVLIAFSACKEVGPIIETGKRVIEDSTYKASGVEQAQEHFVLVEEFTGAKCTNCPAARDLLHDINEDKDHRLITMGIHIFGIVQGAPVEHSKYDFRTEEGNSIKDIYYSKFIGMPSAGFDRVKVGDETVLIPPKWAGAIDERLAKPSPVNMYITSSYDESARKATVEVKVAYTQRMTGVQKLSLVLIEDSLIDKQEHSGKPIQDDYVFMHTFRDYISSINGEAFLENMTTKEPGTVFIRRFKNVDINFLSKASNCKLIAFVHYDDGDNREVLQAVEVHLGE